MSSGYILNLIYVLVLKDLIIVFTHFQMISNTRQDRTQETGIEREKCQDANNMKCTFVCIIHTHTRICLYVYNCQMIICLIQIAHTHSHIHFFPRAHLHLQTISHAKERKWEEEKRNTTTCNHNEKLTWRAGRKLGYDANSLSHTHIHTYVHKDIVKMLIIN